MTSLVPSLYSPQTVFVGGYTVSTYYQNYIVNWYKITTVRTETLFQFVLNKGYDCAMKVLHAYQLLPQLLMEKRVMIVLL